MRAMKLVAVLGALVMFFVAEGISEAGRRESCYPNNQFAYIDRDVSDVGPAFHAFGKGTATFKESEIQFPFQTPYDGPGGSLYWRFEEFISKDTGPHDTPYDGTFGGFLSAIITWDDGRVTQFKSRCMAEVQTIYDCTDTEAPCRLEVEMEAEGIVVDFPDGKAGVQKAVASFVMKREEGTKDLFLKFSLELGTTCFEGDTAEAETEFGFHAGFLTSEDPEENSGTVNGSFSSPAWTAGAWAFPDGYHGDGLFCPGAF